MPDEPSAPQPTPTNYQRTTGGSHLRWQPPTPEHLQEMLPAYEVMSILGQGGMGAVYKGRQKSLDRIVAIKILPPEAGEDDMQFVERFKNEARTMAKMNHPAIVHVYDFGETTEGQLFIVMEFIDGTDVAKMIQEKKKLPEDYALAITAHVCDALGYAHTQGVVHRDIKPANILINMEGQVKVADFGLAKATDPSQMGLTKTNMAMGTPDFVSPEALMPGVPLDGRADLYAMGVMLFNMLTGTIPRGAFRMPSITQGTDFRFDKIIGKAMEMDRELRYQTALDLRRDLDVILTTPLAKPGGRTISVKPRDLPQKPVGKSPSAPQQQRAPGSTGVAVRTGQAPMSGSAAKPGVPPAKTGQNAQTPAALKKESNAGMIYGIAVGVVVIAVAIFLFGGGGKKPVPAPKAVVEVKPEPKQPETKPAITTPKPTATKTAPAPDTVTIGKEQWVDGLAQWFGGTKTNDNFSRKPGVDVRVASIATMSPLPVSAPPMRDMAVRARVRMDTGPEKSALRLAVRSATDASRVVAGYDARIEPEEHRVRLGGYFSGKNFQGFIDYKLPEDFDFGAAHTLEFRVVGDLLTVMLDGRKLGERRDTQLTAGHPVLTGSKMFIESFEYANLDPGGAAPVATPAPPLTAPVNLLALVDVKRDAVKGTWELKPEGLILQKGEKEQILGFPFTPPAEYDFEIEFTLTEGKDAGQILPLPSGAISWKMAVNDDGRYFGFGPTIDGKGLKDKNRTAAVTQRPQLKLNQRYRSVVEVRQGSLRALLDGEEVVKWSGDLSRLKGDASSKLPNPTHLGINSFGGTGMICYKAEVRPPSGSAAASAVAPPLTRTVDLLALVDVKRDAVKGKWLTRPDGLQAQTDTIDGKLQPDQVLGFNQSAPEEYDFEIEFTLGTGNLDVMQVLPSPNGTIHWRMRMPNPGDHTVCGFGPELDGKGFSESGRTEAVAKVAPFQKGQRHRSLVEVRKGSLRALLDGKEIVKWSGDFKRFTSEERFTLPDAKHPGIACFNTITTFHKAELQPPSTAIAASTLPASAPAMPAVASAPAPPADPRLAQLEAGYQARYDADAQKPFLAAVATLNQSYVANGISRARAAAQAKGSLAEVTALDAEKTAIEKGSEVPAEDAEGTPESLKALRSTYRGALTKITAERDAKAAPLLDLYLKALDVYIAELTKAGKVDKAKQVQALRDTKAAPKAAAEVAPSTPAADPATSKMTERELAEWMLSTGAQISIEGMVGIKNAASLPTGRITITTGSINCDKITNADLNRLSACREMTTLNLNRGFPGDGVINLEPIRKLTQLKSLRCDPPRDDASVEIIAGLKNLTTLRLGKTEGKEMETLAAIKELESLRFEAVSAPRFAALKACKNLRILHVHGRPPNVRDVDVADLVAALPDLEELSLGENNTPEPITDAALDELAKLKELKTLYLNKAKVSDASLAKLQKALPDCKVTK